MCGIWGFNWDDEFLDKKLVKAFNHRGPDSSGVFKDEWLTIGHNRLSIIDLSERSKQPMYSKDKNYVISFNGEIFNYKEIKQKLISEGIVFETESDTEVLLEGYIKYGSDILKQIDGQFAFCIYDKSNNELFLARDESGILPLYFYHHQGKFIFGSEMKVMYLSGVKKRVDQYSLLFYLMYGYTPDCRTILQNVSKLKPGHFLKYELDQAQITSYVQYWKSNYDKKITSLESAKEEFLRVTEESVKSRMVADVEVGAFLSGGLDSSTIVHFMSKYTKKLNTFSVSFDKSDYDEQEYAKIIAKKYKTNHRVIEFSAEDVKDLLKSIPEYYDEPFADHSLIPTFLVSKVARNYVKVCLTGDGADELFGGYNKYVYYNTLTKCSSYKKFMNVFGLLPCPAKIARAFDLIKLQDHERFANLNSYQYMEDVKEDNEIIYQKFKEYFNHDHWLLDLQAADFAIYLPEDILTKVDRAGMANSLETRPPFLSRQMIEFANSLDPNLKIKGNTTKFIMKESMRGKLPDKIIDRPKKGFGSPLKHYFRNELIDLIQEKVIDHKGHFYFNYLNLQKVFDDHISNKRDNSRLLFSCLMFNLWWDKWMNC